MPDPVTLSAAAIGAVALKEGVKFLYGQTAEILRRWRERRDKLHEKAAEGVETVPVIVPPVFEGQLSDPAIRFEVVERSEQELLALYKELSGFVSELEPVEPSSRQLLHTIDKLRNALEEIYGQRITFKGENRPPTGALLEGRVIADRIQGKATGVDVEGPTSGIVRGDVKAKVIESGGEAIGVRSR
jgi:hypothetical protein